MTFLLKSELMGGFPACLCARRTKKDKQRGGKLCRPATPFQRTKRAEIEGGNIPPSLSCLGIGFNTTICPLRVFPSCLGIEFYSMVAAYIGVHR